MDAVIETDNMNYTNNKFFFITNYDDISSSLIAFLLNSHSDIYCSLDKSDDLLEPCQHLKDSVDEWIDSHTDSEKRLMAISINFQLMNCKIKSCWKNQNIRYA